MPTTANLTVDASLKARLADLARQAGQDVDEFVEACCVESPPPMSDLTAACPRSPDVPGAPTLRVEDVRRLLEARTRK